MKAETFTKALHSFQSDIIVATKKGRKKKDRLIHVQKHVQIETLIQSSWVKGISKRSSTKRRSGSKVKTCFFLSTEK